MNSSSASVAGNLFRAVWEENEPQSNVWSPPVQLHVLYYEEQYLTALLRGGGGGVACTRYTPPLFFGQIDISDSYTVVMKITH